MVTKNDNGYIVNGNAISSHDAYDLFRFIEREYYKEDIRYKLIEEYDEDIAETIIANSELTERMIDLYCKYRSNDEQWSYDVDEVFCEFRREIEAILEEETIPLF